jgi:hypothetical protein
MARRWITVWLLALVASLSLAQSAKAEPPAWQTYWQKVDAYLRSPEVKSKIQEAGKVTGQAYRCAERYVQAGHWNERYALLCEFWRNRDSIDLLCLLEPENLRILTSFDWPQIEANFARTTAAFRLPQP